MIPHSVSMRYRRRDGRWRRLWVPAVPVVLLLSPLLLLAVVGGLIACCIFKVNFTGAMAGVGRLLWALPGTQVEMQHGRAAVLVNVR